MSRVSVSKGGVRPAQRHASLERHTQRFFTLRSSLEQIGFFCKGTVLKRMMKCGKAQCACAADATKRHGPYYELTYKANGKMLAPVRECTRMAAKAMHQGPIWAAPGILRRRRAQARRSAIRSAAPLQNIVLPSAPST